ncbi:MAG TPA: SH3 domain-containing protein [Anaeromyxobacteraceae bacterium]|nr:SH3 domain-containing protein [Anaeromyxobacteraceae bacterium]
MAGPPAARRPAHLVASTALVALALAGAACSREPRSPPLQLPPAPQETPTDPALRIVLALSPLRKDPAAPPPAKGKHPRAGAGAVLATLHRGERVTWLESRDDEVRVRTSDGTEGWLRANAVVQGTEVHEATVTTPALSFDRPDLLAVNPRRKIEAGTLLLVRKTRDLFTEVDAGPGPSAWVLTDRITERPDDLAAARLVEKGRWLARNDRRGEALEVLALLRSRWPGSPLVQALAVDLGEVPPEGPTGPTGPPAPTGAP